MTNQPAALSSFYCHSSVAMSELDDDSIALTITAPPYWPAVDNDAGIVGGVGDYADYLNYLTRTFSEVYRVTKPGGFCAIVIGTVLLEGRLIPVPFDLTAQMQTTSWEFQEYFVWDYAKVKTRRISAVTQRPYPGYFYPNIRTEYIMLFRKPGPKIYRRTDVDKEPSRFEIDDLFKRDIANNVWHIEPVPHSSIDHPRPFPEEIPHRLVSLYSYHGDAVLDPFVGSGQTSKVAVALGRKAVGYDTNQEHINLAQARIAEPYQRQDQLIPRYHKVDWPEALRQTPRAIAASLLDDSAVSP